MADPGTSPSLTVNVIGLPGSGKSSLCKFLAETRGFWLYRPSDVIREYAKENQIELTSRADYLRCHRALVDSDQLAMIQPVLRSSQALICIDGLRAPAETRYLKEHRSPTIVVAIDCPEQRRYEHVMKDPSRDAHRKFPTLQAFLEDEKPDWYNPDPHMVSMQDMFNLADYHLDGTQTLQQLQDQLSQIVAT